MNIPDRWIVVKIESLINPTDSHYRVFACWYGGFAAGDSWRMNSGITSVELIDDYYVFHGSSKSIYKCHKNSYGTSSYGDGVLRNLEKNSTEISITRLDESTNFLELKYE